MRSGWLQGPHSEFAVQKGLTIDIVIPRSMIPGEWFHQQWRHKGNAKSSRMEVYQALGTSFYYPAGARRVMNTLVGIFKSADKSSLNKDLHVGCVRMFPRNFILPPFGKLLSEWHWREVKGSGVGGIEYSPEKNKILCKNKLRSLSLLALWIDFFKITK